MYTSHVYLFCGTKLDLADIGTLEIDNFFVFSKTFL